MRALTLVSCLLIEASHLPRVFAHVSLICIEQPHFIANPERKIKKKKRITHHNKKLIIFRQFSQKCPNCKNACKINPFVKTADSYFQECSFRLLSTFAIIPTNSSGLKREGADSLPFQGFDALTTQRVPLWYYFKTSHFC